MIGHVYRISDKLGLDVHYVGSTCKSLRERYISHLRLYYSWLQNKNNKGYRNISIFKYLKNMMKLIFKLNY